MAHTRHEGNLRRKPSHAAFARNRTGHSGKQEGHGPELEAVRRQLYAGGKIERREADFLVELHKRVQHRRPAFQQFFYQAIKDHILTQGIDAEEAAWLRRMLHDDGKIDDEERKFLHELKGEAKQVSRKFDVFFEESMKQPPEQRTCDRGMIPGQVLCQSPNAPAVSKLVEATGREFGVRYAEHESCWVWLASHFRWLRQMGIPGTTR